jgi:acyl-CoA reductase-like NAD-dependent aldehyde dehydrogenase/nicotinamidase-related amidase
VIVKPVLLLVDLQNDFLRRSGLMPHPASVVTAAANLLAACRSAGVPIVHVWSTIRQDADNRMLHWKMRDQWSCVEGTIGHACPDNLRPRKAETIVHKSFFSGFSTGQLEPVLRALKANLIIIAGIHLHACVRATALDGYANGFIVLIGEDANANDDPLHAAITSRYLQDRCVYFRNSDEIVAALGENPVNLQQLCVPEAHEVIRHASPLGADRSWQLPVEKKSEIGRRRATAQKAFSSWREVPLLERLKVLQTFAGSLREREQDLIKLLVEDIGKPIRYSRAEVGRALALIAAADKQLLREFDGRLSSTGYRRVPLGVVALISPFNNPLAIPMGKIVPALLYGNAVIWKPAIAGSRIAQLTAECFASATGCPDLMTVIFGGNEVAREIMEMCDAATISGALKTGYAAQEICARRHIPFQAELGGNNASIVWGDADLDVAAAAIVDGAFAFAGQRCTANRRVIVEAKIYDSLVEKLIACTSLMQWGDPRDEKTHVGPLISATSGKRVQAVLERARSSSHLLISPMENLNGQGGDQWVAPTIVCCNDPSAEIVLEETFGPVLVVQEAKNWDEAISLCNCVRQGLVAALFSTSPHLIADFLRRAEAGIVKINSSTADAAVDLPFGGWKASGIGPPEHFPANHEFFSRLQAIYFSSAKSDS